MTIATEPSGPRTTRSFLGRTEEERFPESLYGRLRAPREARPDPRDGLPCRRDPDPFFADDPAQLELAKTYCGGCWARCACLAGALARREPVGVWGGQIFHNGRVIEHKRGRGRPRKHFPEPLPAGAPTAPSTARRLTGR